MDEYGFGLALDNMDDIVSSGDSCVFFLLDEELMLVSIVFGGGRMVSDHSVQTESTLLLVLFCHVGKVPVNFTSA